MNGAWAAFPTQGAAMLWPRDHSSAPRKSAAFAKLAVFRKIILLYLSSHAARAETNLCRTNVAGGRPL
jgi:hypothetical protein